MAAIESASVQVWDMGAEVNKKEGRCKRVASADYPMGSIGEDKWMVKERAGEMLIVGKTLSAFWVMRVKQQRDLTLSTATWTLNIPLPKSFVTYSITPRLTDLQIFGFQDSLVKVSRHPLGSKKERE